MSQNIQEYLAICYHKDVEVYITCLPAREYGRGAPVGALSLIADDPEVSLWLFDLEPVERCIDPTSKGYTHLFIDTKNML